MDAQYLMPKLLHLLTALLSLSCLASAAEDRGERNDGMYPPAPAAKAVVDIDGAGFIINGKRVFLASGAVHYPRVPRGLWRDVLLRLKRGGMNCVETYAFWNFHERREGQIDFTTDEHDLSAFLKIAQDLDLYAIVRVGPYVCAEWNAGGYPAWLRFKQPGFPVRTNNPEYLKWNDHWYQAVLPIVAEHQITKGGNVIMVQLENEHPKGWGYLPKDPYFAHHYEVAVKHGIVVPIVMSGLHHGGAPKPERNLDTQARTTPWFSTEFWAGWFDRYGAVSLKKQREVENATWCIAAFGGGGYNYYMAHGGTNFDVWNDVSSAASYDYGAIIGQAGDLRPNYYLTKRTNQFAMSFVENMATARDATNDFKGEVSGGTLAGARKGPAGTFLFLQGKGGNTGKASIATVGSASVSLPTSGFLPLVRQMVVDPKLTIADSTLAVLGVARHTTALTVTVYGHPGDRGRLVLEGPGLRAGEGSNAYKATGAGDKVDIEITVPAADGVEEFLVDQGERVVRVLVTTRAVSLRAWTLGEPGKQWLAFGPALVLDAAITGGKPVLTIERPLTEPACGQVAVFAGKGQAWRLGATANVTTPVAPAVGSWKMAFSPEADAVCDQTGWPTGETPPALGADGDDGVCGWYRTVVEVPKAGAGTIFSPDDKNRLAFFVNGRKVVKGEAEFRAGRNVVAAFLAFDGRNKAWGYTGRWDTYDIKALSNRTKITVGDTVIPVKSWALRGGIDPARATGWIPLGDTGGRPGYFKTTFTLPARSEFGVHPVLRADTRRLTFGAAWLNGKALGRYPEKIPVNGLYLPECWLKDGENTLVVFDEQGADPRALGLYVETTASREVMRVVDPVSESTPMVVPAENPVRDLVAANRTNAAFLKTATCDATGPKVGNPAVAVDGDQDTGWAAPDNKPGHWVAVDLGTSTRIVSCELLWNLPSLTFVYKVEGSIDGKDWKPLGDQTTAVPTSPDSPSEVSRLIFPPTEVRHLRVTVANGPRNWNLCELRAIIP